MDNMIDDVCRWKFIKAGGLFMSSSANTIASRFWMGWNRFTADLEKYSPVTRRKRRVLDKIRVRTNSIRQRVTWIQVVIWRECKGQILCQQVACANIVRSIRIYVGSLLEQIDCDAMTIENKDAFSHRAY